ncbi:MAG: hypothetical protein ACRDRE_24680 [Pseudonocardiaceae bacterium]
MRAGHLLGDRGVDLVFDQTVLHRDQQILRFGQLQTQRVRSQPVAI